MYKILENTALSKKEEDANNGRVRQSLIIEYDEDKEKLDNEKREFEKFKKSINSWKATKYYRDD